MPSTTFSLYSKSSGIYKSGAKPFNESTIKSCIYEVVSASATNFESAILAFAALNASRFSLLALVLSSALSYISTLNMYNTARKNLKSESGLSGIIFSPIVIRFKPTSSNV